MNRAFLIFSGGRGNHSVVYSVRAPTVLAAIQRWMLDTDKNLVFRPDGSVLMPSGRKPIVYPHSLAYIEAHEKVFTEWQIREVPVGAWDKECEELFCGECAYDIECHIERCLPILRQELPRSRPRAFVWYLQDGALVTFFRRSRPFQIEVLRRYLHGPEEPAYRPWTGTYDDILDQLWQRWDWKKQGLVG